MRDPRTAVAFDWDDANEFKLAARGVLPVEVERVFDNSPVFYRGKRKGTARWMMQGQDPVTGRRMRVGVLWKDAKAGVLRAIHVLPLE